MFIETFKTLMKLSKFIETMYINSNAINDFRKLIETFEKAEVTGYLSLRVTMLAHASQTI